MLVEQLRSHVGGPLHCCFWINQVDFSLPDKARHAKVYYFHSIVVSKEDVICFEVDNLNVCIPQGLDLVTKLQLEKNRVLKC